MTRLAVQKVQENFSDTLDRVANKRERIILHRQGKNVAALVPVEDLALLQQQINGRCEAIDALCQPSEKAPARRHTA